MFDLYYVFEKLVREKHMSNLSTVTKPEARLDNFILLHILQEFNYWKFVFFSKFENVLGFLKILWGSSTLLNNMEKRVTDESGECTFNFSYKFCYIELEHGI